MSPKNSIILPGIRIQIKPDSHYLIQLAARELSRYLFQLTGKVSPVVKKNSSGAVIKLLSKCPNAPSHFNNVSEQRFSLKTLKNTIVIIGETPLGTLYGIYSLLEYLGFGFYLGGDTVPEKKIRVITDLNVTHQPVFAVRGSNLHGNLVTGASGWGEYDWRFYIDQTARMRCNLFILHLYDSEPGAGYEIDGRITGQGKPHSSMTNAFGINPSPTSDFSFGTEAFFDQEVFGAPPVEKENNIDRQISGMEKILRDAICYGRLRGVLAAVGFEAPTNVDCTDKTIRLHFKERVRQFIRRYPELSYFCLWQCEGRGLLGEDIPKSKAAEELIKKHRKTFAYLGAGRRIYGGIHLAEFALMTYEILKKEAPQMRLVICGWGGDKWMRFADFGKGLDKILPKNIILTCHDSINPTMDDGVSDNWKYLTAKREIWAQPWMENDADDMWTRQANVESLGKLLPDVLNKGCHGTLALHWRTKDFEEELGYLARFSWNSKLTTEEYYADCALKMFGGKHRQVMQRILGDLQRLGNRWTGITGGKACGYKFRWTGYKPHWPYEMDDYAVDLLIKRAWDAFDYFKGNKFNKTALQFSNIARKLEKLSNRKVSGMNLTKFTKIEEQIYGIRENLILKDTPLKTWIAVDSFLQPLHHLTTRANNSLRTKQLKTIRSKLASLNIKNSERYNFLLNTIDVVIALDRVSIALASPGPVKKLLTQAEKKLRRGQKQKARKVAEKAYKMIIDIKIQEMLYAQTNKLSTQCEWGVLALMNLKALPAYWKTLSEAEKFMTAIPPRKLNLSVEKSSVKICWKCLEPAWGYYIYRKNISDRHFQRINHSPVKALFHQRSPYCFFHDHPPAEIGVFEYAITAIDKQGRESPLSYAETISLDKNSHDIRIIGRHQGFCFLSGQQHEIRVIIPSNTDIIESVILKYRKIGSSSWLSVPMLRFYRYGYHGIIPKLPKQVAAVEYYVEVLIQNTERFIWPVNSNAGKYWTATII